MRERIEAIIEKHGLDEKIADAKARVEGAAERAKGKLTHVIILLKAGWCS